MLFYELEIRKEIRDLRSCGYTYSEIQGIVNRKIPKSSISYICKDLNLSPKAKQRLKDAHKAGTEKSRRLAVLANRNAREGELEKLRADNVEFSTLSDREAKIALAYLYLGEGGKWRSHRGLYLGNSDPRVIRTYIYLINRCYGIGKGILRGGVSYRYDQDLITLQKYWSNITGIPIKNFHKSIPDPRTKGKPTRRLDYMGVCRISCAGTKYQLELDIIADIIDHAIRGIGAAG